MGNTRKRPVKAAGKKSKTTGGKRSTVKTGGRTAPAAAEGRKTNERVRDEIVSIIIVAAGIFLAVAFQTSAAGALGTALSQFFKGCFGFAAYILPYYFIVYGILLFMKKTIHVGIKSSVLLIIIFLMIALINAGRYIDPQIITSSLGRISVYYNNGMILDDGGVFGMVIGSWIVRLIGLPGLYIMSVVVIIICLLLLMNTPVSRFLEKIKEKKKKRSEDREMRRIEKEQKQAEKARHMDVRQLHEQYAGEQEQPSSITDGQRKILGYMKGDGPFNAQSSPREEPHSGGSSRPEMSPEAEAVINEPIIKGGFSPKAVEEKLTKEEARKSMLREEDFNASIASAESYKFPPVSLLAKGKRASGSGSNEKELMMKAEKLEATLQSFNIDARVTNVSQGPAVTRYEVHPNSGVKVKGIVNLADDIALNMEAKSIRIEAPIPGKPAVGIEIENDRINMVTIREIIDSAVFRNATSKISFAVGRDISGNAIVADLKSMPHLLIAGSTGSGKSVCINSIITSILYKARPDEVKLVLVDPKVVELANYNGIPHLLIPVVTEPSKAAAALNWAVAEMDERYRKFAEEGVRELASYNRTVRSRDEEEKVMPQIVIIIDELADLMMAAPSQVEESICRLAQKARAAGMHLIVATQRPSVDVITGVIKANIPSRIAFAVSSQFDSRTILDMSGAEKLVGKGDMLFNPLGSGKPLRVQGTFISDEEVHKVIEFVKEQAEEVEYSGDVMDSIEKANSQAGSSKDEDEGDTLLPDAIELVVQSQQASVSMLQRRFRIGYNRAARIIDMMEERQIVGPPDGSRPRNVLITEEDLMNMKDSEEEKEDS